MCVKLVRKIAVTDGFGWKVFDKTDGELRQFDKDNYTYDGKLRKGIEYDDTKYYPYGIQTLSHEKIGFCFFFDKPSAEQFIGYWSHQFSTRGKNLVVRRIQFKEGIGEGIDSFVPVRTGLCRWFRTGFLVLIRFLVSEVCLVISFYLGDNLFTTERRRNKNEKV